MRESFTAYVIANDETGEFEPDCFWEESTDLKTIDLQEGFVFHKVQVIDLGVVTEEEENEEEGNEEEES